MRMATRWTSWGAVVVLLGALGCNEGAEPQTAADADDPCGPEEDVAHAAETAGSGAKTGATTAWEGMKTFGKSVGGLFSGGTDEAEQQWKEGAEETKKTAKQGAQETKTTARKKPCPEKK
jgi:hypothetical protein